MLLGANIIKKRKGSKAPGAPFLFLAYIHLLCFSTCTSAQHHAQHQQQQHNQHNKQTIISINVKENLPPGTLVANISAPDGFFHMDGTGAPPASSQVLYSITGGDGIGRFSVDYKGRVHTRTVLDYEIGSKYWLTVTGVSRGTIETSFTTVININILNDESDDIPLLEEPFYYIKLLENSTVNQQLMQVRASLQYPSNNNAAINNHNQNLEYTLLNNVKLFNIDQKTGIVSLRSRPIHKNYTSYVLDVRIAKSTQSDTQQAVIPTKVPIIVEVIDINDNEPEPFIVPWRCIAHSNIEPSVPICTLPVSDADTGLNSQLTFSVSVDDETNEQNFRIDNRTGTIYRKNSSRELNKNTDYVLYISVVDHGVPFLETSVKILIKIIEPVKTSNKNMPMLNPIYDTEFRIAENSKVGDTIALLSVNDIDGDKILTHIVSGNDDGEFTLNDGALIIARKLSFSRSKTDKLVIMATDGSTKAYQNLTIIIPGQSRAIPNRLFHHNITISESETIVRNDSSPFLDISGDAYNLKNAKFSIYSVSSEDAWSAFSVEECCGIIRLNRQLDHEMCKSYEIVIQIIDTEYPLDNFRSFSRINIKVLDSNDWTPSFLSSEYRVRIPETAPVSTPIIQLQAIDLDIGKNAELSYYIVSGNEKDLFGINETLGTLFVKRELEDLTSERNSEFKLQVMAKDNGHLVQLNGTTEVSIIVTVPKYIPPKFSKKVYHLKLREDLPAESAIFKVQATSESHGLSLYYTILEGNDDNTFILNSNSGELVLLRVFDHEVKQQYELTIAADVVSPSNRALRDRKTHAECKINITVIDVNDNKPMFKSQLYQGQISRLAKIGDPVLESLDGSPLKLVASDQDAGENGLINYGITIPAIREFLSIDQAMQTINITRPLDDQPKELTFTVFAHDLGTPSLTSESVATVVVQVINPPTKPPKIIPSTTTTTTTRLPVFQTTAPVATINPTTPSYTSTVITHESPSRIDFSIYATTPSPPNSIYNYTSINQDLTKLQNGTAKKVNNGVDMPYDPFTQLTKPRDPSSTRQSQRPLAFSGSSYIRYNVAKPSFEHLSLKFRTHHRSFILMYSNNSRGHYVLDAQESFLRFRFDLTGGGGGSGLIQLRSIKIDDGRWHDLIIERVGISFTLTVDSIYTASGAAPFAQPSISREFEPVFQYYFGAEADLATDLGTSSRTPKKFGFAGCLDEIYIDSTRLSISEEGVYHPDLLLVNIELGCHQVPLPPITINETTEIDFRSVYILFYSLAASAMFLLFCCVCCVCVCCCRRKSRSRKRRRKNEVLLRNHHHQLSNTNMEDSFTRSMNSRHSLRVAHSHTPPAGRAHHSKYGAGDTVSLSAITERKLKPPMALPPIPIEENRDENGEDNYENFATITGVFGPGHPEFLNELRKLKPDFTRMSTRAPPTPKKQTSASTMNSIITTSDNSKPVRSPRPSKNSGSNSNIERVRQSNTNISENLPPKNSRSNIGSKSNIRESLSPIVNNPKYNQNNNNASSVINQVSQRQRPILVNGHHQREHSGGPFISSNNQPSNTTEDPDYDEVDTELDSGDSDSGSELPSETRFLTFTRKKKRKKDELTNGHPSQHEESDTETGANEDTDNGVSTDQIDDQFNESRPQPDVRASRQAVENVRSSRSGNAQENGEDSDEDEESEDDEAEEGVYEINREMSADNTHRKKEEPNNASSTSNSSSDDNVENEERNCLNGHANGRRVGSNHDYRYRRHSQQASQITNGHQHYHHSVGRTRGHNRSISNDSAANNQKESDDL